MEAEKRQNKAIFAYSEAPRPNLKQNKGWYYSPSTLVQVQVQYGPPNSVCVCEKCDFVQITVLAGAEITESLFKSRNLTIP